MPVDFGLRRVDGGPARTATWAVPSEPRLEALIEGDPDIPGQPVLLIARQAATRHAKVVDLPAPARFTVDEVSRHLGLAGDTLAP